MKVTMSTLDLKAIFEACKGFVSKSDLRPAMQGIQLNFSNKQCTAYAMDNIKLMQIVVPYTDGDEGTMLVPMIKLPRNPFVTLSDEGNELVFDFHSCKQTVRKYAGDFLQEPDRCFPTADPNLTIYFDPKSLKDALDGFKTCTAIELQFHGQTGGCTIYGKNRKALILPVRPPKNI